MTSWDRLELSELWIKKSVIKTTVYKHDELYCLLGPDGGLPCECMSRGGGRVGWGPSLYGGRPGAPPYGGPGPIGGPDGGRRSIGGRLWALGGLSGRLGGLSPGMLPPGLGGLL